MLDMPGEFDFIDWIRHQTPSDPRVPISIGDDMAKKPGIWIGARHALYLPGGPPRVAGRVLIWQHRLLTLRLEAAVGRERALAIARSVR